MGFSWVILSSFFRPLIMEKRSGSSSSCAYLMRLVLYKSVFFVLIEDEDEHVVISNVRKFDHFFIGGR